MSGIDTVRGIGFQHAVTVGAVVDLLDREDLTRIDVEATEDIVDFQLIDGSDRRCLVEQVKSRATRAWFPGEIWELLVRWAELPEEEATYCFSTDGSFGPGASDIEDIVHRCAARVETEADREAILSHNLTLDMLRRVRFEVEIGSTSSVLIHAERRLHRLLEMQRPVTTDDVHNAVNALVRWLTELGSGGRPRSLSRVDAASLVGLDLSTVGIGALWSDETRSAYQEMLRSSLDAVPTLLKSVGQEGAIEAIVQRQLVLPEPNATPVDLDGVMQQYLSFAVLGAAGAGKTTTLRGVGARLAATDAVPVLINVRAAPGSLDRALRGAVETVVGHRLAPSAVADIRRDPKLVLLLDRALDVSDSHRQGLMAAVRELRLDNPSARVIISGRSRGMAEPWELTVFELVGLTTDQQTTIGHALLPEGTDVEATCNLVRTSLGGAAGNPMVFTMGLWVRDRLTSPAKPAQAYRAFIGELAIRAGQSFDGTLIVLGVLAWGLVEEGLPSIDRYEWIDRIAKARQELEPHQLGLPDVGAVARQAEELGVVTTDPWGEVSWLHDSFIEFFGAWSIQRGYAALPTSTRGWANGLSLLAQLNGMTTELATLLCSDPALATKLALYDERTWTAELVDETEDLLEQLREPLGDDDPVATQRHLRIWSADGLVVAALTPEAPSRLCPSANEAAADPTALSLVTFETRRALGVATVLWDMILDRYLDGWPVTMPHRVPPERSQLAESVAEQFRSLRDEVEKVARKVCPGQIDGLVQASRLNGMVGILGPPQPDPSGGSSHILWYRREPGVVEVTIGPPPEDGNWSARIAENFLDSSPEVDAVEEFRRAFSNIIEGER